MRSLIVTGIVTGGAVEVDDLVGIERVRRVGGLVLWCVSTSSKKKMSFRVLWFIFIIKYVIVIKMRGKNYKLINLSSIRLASLSIRVIQYSSSAR